MEPSVSGSSAMSHHDEQKRLPPLSLLPAAATTFSRSELQIASFPLILLGIPTHLLFPKQLIKPLKRGWMGWGSSWLRLHSLPLVALTFVLFFLALSFNAYILYNIYVIFDLLVLKGQLTLVVFQNLLKVFQCLPILLPLNYIWVRGHALLDLVKSFTEPNPDSESFILNPDLISHISNRGQSRRPMESRRLLLLGLFACAMLIHLGHSWLYFGIHVKHGLVSAEAESIRIHFANYVLGPVFSFCLMNIYVVTAWALSRQIRVINNFLRNLDPQDGVKLESLHAFKVTFRDLANRMEEVNLLFSIYLSFVLFNVLLSMYTNEIADLEAISMVQATDPELIDQRSVIRIIIWVVVSFLLKTGLIMYTVGAAVEVNDGARAINLWMNHLVTMPNADMTVEKYYAFRLLKSYVHSRYQEPLPVLLRISIAGDILFCLQYRLHPIPPGQYD